jgi:hypothetical protein
MITKISMNFYFKYLMNIVITKNFLDLSIKKSIDLIFSCILYNSNLNKGSIKASSLVSYNYNNSLL